jgi:hypothetical protein
MRAAWVPDMLWTNQQSIAGRVGAGFYIFAWKIDPGHDVLLAGNTVQQ